MKSLRSIAFALTIGAALATTLILSSWKTSTSPDFEKLSFTNLQGKVVKLSDYQGKAVFVNFFATSCPRCRAELPSIEGASAHFTDRMTFLMVSDESVETLNEFKAKSNYPGLEFIKINKGLKEMGINSIPSTFVYDSEGTLVLEHGVIAQWDDKAMLKRLEWAVK